MAKSLTISVDDFVEPQLTDIRKCWDYVKEGINSILEADSNISFRPEDIYSECVNERAFLFTSPTGFLVLTTLVDALTGDKSLLILLAYVHETGKHNWPKHVQWFEDVARGADCRFIEARCSVPEMEDYAIKQGFILNTRVYTKEVDGKRT